MIIKPTRLYERSYSASMMAVSLVFAVFILGIGSKLIGDLPGSGEQEDRPSATLLAVQERVDTEKAKLQQQSKDLDDKKQIADLQLEQAQKASTTETETFHAWAQARTATTDPRQDPEVISRVKELERLKGIERSLQEADDAIDNQRAENEQKISHLEAELSAAETADSPYRMHQQFMRELKVFLLRLLISLPALLLAVWLTMKKRKSDYWPFYRGFVLAAAFVFFVELIPYLPSYGGYVRNGVGVVLTLWFGLIWIRNMKAFLKRRREAEQQAEDIRRKQVGHDEAFQKINTDTCPGCDRKISRIDGVKTNFCVHCGMTLFSNCGSCGTRNVAFSRFCVSCGVPNEGCGPAEAPPTLSPC